MKNRLLNDLPGAVAALQRDSRRTWRLVALLIARLVAVAMGTGGALVSLPVASAEAPVLLIAQPSDQETIHDNTGEVPVVVTLLGAEVTAGRHLRVLLDAKTHAEQLRSLSFTIAHVDRGEHSLRVELVDESNNVVAVSPTLTFYVWQASRLAPPGLR